MVEVARAPLNILINFKTKKEIFNDNKFLGVDLIERKIGCFDVGDSVFHQCTSQTSKKISFVGVACATIVQESKNNKFLFCYACEESYKLSQRTTTELFIQCNEVRPNNCTKKMVMSN